MRIFGFQFCIAKSAALQGTKTGDALVLTLIVHFRMLVPHKIELFGEESESKLRKLQEFLAKREKVGIAPLSKEGNSSTRPFLAFLPEAPGAVGACILAVAYLPKPVSATSLERQEQDTKRKRESSPSPESNTKRILSFEEYLSTVPPGAATEPPSLPCRHQPSVTSKAVGVLKNRFDSQ